MSSKSIKLWPIVWKQFQMKWKANIDLLSGLAIFQVIALLFSVNGSGTFNYGSGMEFRIYTGDLIVVFTMIWLIAIGVQILRPVSALTTYTMVANRKSDHLSNIIWLIVMSVIGVVAVVLATILLQVIMGYFGGGSQVQPEVQLSTGNYLMGVGTIYMYVLFAGAVGYFFGVLSQWNQMIKVFLPLLLIGALLVAPNIIPENILIGVFSFIFLEKVFALFILKMLVLTSLLFLASMSMGNRLEVRK